MGKLIQFWRKDAINKLIALVVLVIIVVLGVLVAILANPPGGKSFVDRFLPTATMSVGDVFKNSELTATAKSDLTRTATIPTITTMPFTPMVTSTSAATPSPAAKPPVPTSTPVAITNTPAATQTATLSLAPSKTPLANTITTSPTPIPMSGECPPRKNEQVGKVLEIVDGATIRVLIGDLVYVVRYIGLSLPEDPNFADLSRVSNGQLVFAKEVKLYPDGVDKDEANRLLRYVLTADQVLVNQELIHQGLAGAVNSPYSCAKQFLSVEQDAKDKHSGMWK